MATIPLHLDDAVDDFGTPTYVTDRSAIVDDDLATYVDLATPSIGHADEIHANFDPPPATATSVSLTLVAARLTDNLSRLVWDIFDQDDMEVGSQHRLDAFPINTPITYNRTFDDAYFAPGGQGETEDFVNPSGLTFADFLDNLRSNGPPYLRFFTNLVGSGAKVIRLYTATLTYEGPGVVPPCHLYPRDDDQGAGSGAIWPPGSSDRPGSYY